MRRIIQLLLLTAVTLLPSAVFAGDDPPAWMRQAVSATAPGYEKDVPAVVLHDEQNINLSSDGRLVSTENHAVRLLTKEGRSFAIARAFYLANASKVREISAWLIRRDGTVKSYDKKTVLDVIADPDDVYNEGRIKVIDGTEDALIGDTFGYTVVTEDTPLFYQDSWAFQSRLPTLLSRYSLSMPNGWTATSKTFNAAEVNPQVSGSSYSWEMRNLPPIPREPFSPAVENLAPRVVINYTPAVNQNTVHRVFADWTDVSRWATTLHDPQVIVDDDVAAKARELTANATTEFEKIRAIGAYVQNLQYISIDIGVGYGNGYKPRSSSLVMSRGYGDCKDKANLMRAMLRSLKIDAYPIAIFSGDPEYVREQWASPRQFNHCIIAVKVSPGTQSPTIIEHAKLGRLLIFDATDSFTPVGDLPDYLQGSLALIIAGDNGGIARMPVTPPDTDLLERKIEATITETGSLSGQIREYARGQSSASFRREYRSLSAPDYRKAIEGWLAGGSAGARLDTLKATDGAGDATFNLEVGFTSESYAQVMQRRLLVFKPVVVARRGFADLNDGKRTNPIEIGASALRETAVFSLPAGFVVDEIPSNTTLDSQFGKYLTKYEVKDNKLHFTRELKLARTMLPVDKYGSARDFFAKMREAEQAPVVLVKK